MLSGSDDDELLRRVLLACVLSLNSQSSSIESERFTEEVIYVDEVWPSSFTILLSSLLLVLLIVSSTIVLLYSQAVIKSKVDALSVDVDALKDTLKETLKGGITVSAPVRPPINRCLSAHDLEVERAEAVHKRFDKVKAWADRLREEKGEFFAHNGTNDTTRVIVRLGL